MTDKVLTIFECSNCGAQFPKWNGRCLECGGWGTLAKQLVDKKEMDIRKLESTPAEIIKLNEIDTSLDKRMPTGISEVDRVLGGGFVAGSLVLLAGEPGIGKSTILAQIADAIVAQTENKNIIYVSGEESAVQIKSRLERLNCRINNINFINETNLEKIIATVVQIKPSLTIIDSIQTVYSSLIPSEA